MSRFSRFVSYLKGFSEEQKVLLDQARQTLPKEQYKELVFKCRDKEVELSAKSINIAGITAVYPHFSKHPKINQELALQAHRKLFNQFAEKAFDYISEHIAPHILGMDHVKQAACLQLFADERLHLLLLGDPGTGKTDILRSAAAFATKSRIGLGSGISNAGLSLALVKGEIQKGLLVQADQGLCCIDELNLMKKEDRAALYNAMEKGFVTFDKGGKSEKFSADVRILATANPKGDQFEGETVEELKKQLPFAPALLSRFHITFLIRRPDTEEFVKIAKKIVRQKKAKKADVSFVKDYIEHALKTEVDFPTSLEKRITQAAKKIKEKEEELLIDVSPRIVKGIIGFAKASARCQLRSKVNKEDVDRVLQILGSSLQLSL